MTTPQSQAEAMAKELFQDVWFRSMDEEKKALRLVSTALSKLIAENGGNKDLLRAANQGERNALALLTATEAKLEKATKIVQLAAQAECDCSPVPFLLRKDQHSTLCALHLKDSARAFLSTLTAEKKESE